MTDDIEPKDAYDLQPKVKGHKKSIKLYNWEKNFFIVPNDNYKKLFPMMAIGGTILRQPPRILLQSVLNP